MYTGKLEFQGSTCCMYLPLYLAPPVQNLSQGQRAHEELQASLLNYTKSPDTPKG